MTSFETNATSQNHTPKIKISPEQVRCFLAELGITDDLHGLELVRCVRRLSNAYESATNERLRHEQLSEQRWRLLLSLWLEEQLGNQEVNPTHLAYLQNVSKNTISALLRSLEEQGLIERTLDSDDLRQFHIRLSQSGRTLIHNTMPGHIAFLNQLASDLSLEEIEQLQRLLHKLHSSVLKQNTKYEIRDTRYDS